MYMWIAIFIDESDFSFSSGHEEYIGVFETEELATEAVVDTLIFKFDIDDIENSPREILDEFSDCYMIDKVEVNFNYLA